MRCMIYDSIYQSYSKTSILVRPHKKSALKSVFENLRFWSPKLRLRGEGRLRRKKSPFSNTRMLDALWTRCGNLHFKLRDYRQIKPNSFHFWLFRVRYCFFYVCLCVFAVFGPFHARAPSKVLIQQEYFSITITMIY